MCEEEELCVEKGEKKGCLKEKKFMLKRRSLC